MLSTTVGRTLGGLALLLAATIPVEAEAATPYSEWGYVTMDDGAELRYDVVRPAQSGRYPTLVLYSPYADGTDPTSTFGDEAPTVNALLAAGFAVAGVNERGTGCSSGRFDFADARAAADGAAVIEWAASQPWSTGRVGMFGDSAVGILQFGPAALQPPHLVAIAPFNVLTDFYRDTAYPGGIQNAFVGMFGLAIQPSSSDKALAGAAQQGDTLCAQHLAQQQIDNPATNPFLENLAHPYDDFWRAREPETLLSSITVPVLGCVTWQDDLAGSRNGSFYFDELDPETTWVLGSGGYHGMCVDPEFQTYLVRFLRRFVAEDPNGFDATPHVVIFHDSQIVGAGPVLPLNETGAISAPSWVTTHPTWPVHVHAVTLYLRSRGRLSRNSPTGLEPADAYRYPMPSASNEDGAVLGQTNLGWKVPSLPGGSVSFTTQALSDDAEFFGPGSVNLWLTSTAADTDLQVTLTEVRPDGQEVYIERGWLRASHRKLDPDRSTELRPYQTHLATDQQPLVPGEPTLVRVELFPFDYVFRAGSSIRLIVDAPTGVTGSWALDFLKIPATNAILHDASHDSQLVLGLVPGGHAEQPLPPCDSLLNQPCRPNLAPVPQGEMSANAALSVPELE